MGYLRYIFLFAIVCCLECWAAYPYTVIANVGEDASTAMRALIGTLMRMVVRVCATIPRLMMLSG